jgi:curved DNA-binding protein CbpA
MRYTVPLPDYYALLEVSSGATQAEIKRSYRRLARRYHPDLNAAALDKHIKRLNEAYRVLGNASKRAAYDRQRQRAEQLRREARAERAERAERLRRETQMTWVEGIFGFVRELRKALRED